MKTKLLKEFIQTLKQNGFKVYTSQKDENLTYVIFEKNGLGYVQESNFSVLSFSSIHYPSRGNGSRYGIHDEVFYPEIHHAETAINTIRPNWAKPREGINEPIKKYKSFEEYRNQPINKILTYREL